MTDIAIETAGVRRAFGSVQAVVNVDLAVKKGTVTALVGPNGCGKTTLMLMLAGLLAPDAGTISVAGEDPTHGDVKARTAVGWMPDVLGTWETLTCVELLSTFGRAYGMTKADATQRAHELLDQVHLSEYSAQSAGVLSRGQKQRLSLARALVHDPPVLLLDEPASGLDPRSRVELRTLLRAKAAEGKTILISSHVLSELDEMVDGAVFMSKGKTLDDNAVAKISSLKREWRIAALDMGKLAAALDKNEVSFTRDADAIVVSVASEKEAAVLLTDLVKASIAVTRFAPQGGKLEQAYMALDEERR